jgi:hypothetical protein
MGRFETKWLSRPENLAALADLPGHWIDKVQQRRPPRIIVLDMDSSESPTYGEQEGSAYNGHFGCTCYHPLFVSAGSSPSHAGQASGREDHGHAVCSSAHNSFGCVVTIAKLRPISS